MQNTREFVVKFQTASGDILPLHVTEEMYFEFEIGWNGVLTVTDGNFYGFAIKEGTPSNTQSGILIDFLTLLLF